MKPKRELTRITIRLDQDIVDRFFQLAKASCGTAGYQALINAALRSTIRLSTSL